MKLYLMQHGEAAGKDVDPERALTAEGRANAEAVAAFLKDAGIAIPLIWHSGKTRARQTAEILAAALSPGSVVAEQSGLAPKDPITPVYKELAASRDDLAVVGHLPFLSHLASELLCGDEGAKTISFQNAGVVCLERTGSEEWQVLWVVVSSLLRKA